MNVELEWFHPQTLLPKNYAYVLFILFDSPDVIEEGMFVEVKKIGSANFETNGCEYCQYSVDDVIAWAYPPTFSRPSWV